MNSLNHSEPPQRKKSPKAIFRELATIGASHYLSQAINLARGFLIVRWLDPSSYGIWNLLKMFIYSTEYFGLGSTYAMAREIPLNTAKKLPQENTRIQRAVLNGIFLLSVFIGGTAFAVATLPAFHSYQFEIRLACLGLVLLGPVYFMKEKLFSEDRIIALGQYQFFLTLITAVFAISFLATWGLRGLVMSTIVSWSLILLFLLQQGSLPLFLGLDVQLLWRLIRSGFPMLLVFCSFTFMQNIDTLFIATFLGKEQTGYYSLAVFVASTVQYIPASISHVLFPKMMFRFGQDQDRQSVEAFFNQPLLLLSVALPVLLGLMVIHAEWSITWLLPRYIPAIPALKILTLSLVFSAFTLIANDLLMAFNKQVRLLQLMASILVIGISLDALALRFESGTPGIAAATGITFFLAANLLCGYVYFLFGKKPGEILNKLLRLNAPLFYSLAALLLGDLIFKEISPSLLRALPQTVLFLVLQAPWLLVLSKTLRKLFASRGIADSAS